MKFGKWGISIIGIGILLASLLLAGCTGTKQNSAGNASVEGKVTAQGSTALLPILKVAQEEFETKHPKVTINITGGGSFTGMNQVANKSVDIGNSDVVLPKELSGKGLVDHKVVVIPFVLIANPDVNVSNLTTEQAKGILSGKIINWREVGGEDRKITIIGRSKSSGSRATIGAIVLGGQSFDEKAVVLDSNGAVKTAVSTTPGAIGYVDAPYADKSVKVLDYNGVKYSEEGVTSGKYPIFSYGHMYTNGKPTGAVKAFIDFVMSKEFQEANVSKTGFIAITKMNKG